MFNEFTVITKREVRAILDLRDALDDRLDPYFAKIIDRVLREDSSKFHTKKFQDDICDIIEKNEIDV